MKTNELYASPWLKAEDLLGKTRELKIASAAIEELHQSDGTKQNKVVVSFVGAKKKLILNKSQHSAICTVAGSDETDVWIGAKVLLSPGMASNGKGTINVTGIPTIHEDGTDGGNPF